MFNQLIKSPYPPTCGLCSSGISGTVRLQAQSGGWQVAGSQVSACWQDWEAVRATQPSSTRDKIFCIVMSALLQTLAGTEIVLGDRAGYFRMQEWDSRLELRQVSRIRDYHFPGVLVIDPSPFLYWKNKNRICLMSTRIAYGNSQVSVYFYYYDDWPIFTETPGDDISLMTSRVSYRAMYE